MNAIPPVPPAGPLPPNSAIGSLLVSPPSGSINSNSASFVGSEDPYGRAIVTPNSLESGSGTGPSVSPVNPATNNAPLEFNTTKNKPPVGVMTCNINSSCDDDVIIALDEIRSDDRRDRDVHERGRTRPKSREKERERDRDRSRGRDRLRERDRERDRGRDRERERQRGRERQRKDSEGNSRSSSEGIVNVPPPPPPIDASTQPNQGFMGPWGPVWGPMGAPMGPIGPVGGPVGPVGPMGPPMGPMPGPMAAPVDAPPLSGDFRITWGMFNWMISPEGLTVPIKNPLHCKTCVLIPPNRLAPPPSTRERPPGCRTVFVGGLPENATGYRMRIDNLTDPANTGRLHVDYAQARDDQYEYECRQRQLLREQRHRERMEAERLRPPSPPPVVHFSEHEASMISDQLKIDGSFSKAAQILITWLERGDCNKRNAGIFYSMVQSTNSHVRRLMTEKGQYEEELAKFREQTRARMQGVIMQFGQIERVFIAACRQKAWDHFTKAQRRNIEMWKKQAEEIRSVQLEESDKDDTEEMDVSDDEGVPILKKKRISDALKEENDSLRCQVEAYKNEVDLIKADFKSDLQQKDDHIDGLKKALSGMQQTLAENIVRKRQDENKICELESKMKKMKENLAENSSGDTSLVDTLEESSQSSLASANQGLIVEKAAWLIGLISTFLHIHPKGASVDYIWSYIQQFDKEIRPAAIENLLNRYPSVYKQTTTGVGACLERKWTFTGFKEDRDLLSNGYFPPGPSCKAPD